MIDSNIIEEMVVSEISYMLDRMEAIAERPGNPEGIHIATFGNAMHGNGWGKEESIDGDTYA
ncbi:hypothetical protein MO973_04345 [Paenibacillus sp. TRM 82003]|nr:hypothetical protein [Paenibacillus sp. TRM 82003]